MKDEIKEMNLSEMLFNRDERLLDCITNLREENKILKENAEHNDKVVDKAKWNEMIYKSRNEKAIEYIKNKQELNKMFGTITLSKNSQNELLNILNGGDKNE